MRSGGLACVLALSAAASACGGRGRPASARTALPSPAPSPRPPPLSEAGRLELAGAPRCAATLLAPSAAITAAHCLAPGMTEMTPGDAVLVLGASGSPFRFPVDRAVAFGGPDMTSRTGFNGDVALIHLARPVPGEVATPRPIASRSARAGDEVTFVRRAAVARAPRVETWRFDPALEGRVMRPGDSGGPLLLGGARGLAPIVGVASGYATTPCASTALDRMLFGDVSRFNAEIEQTLAAWDREGGARESAGAGDGAR